MIARAACNDVHVLGAPEDLSGRRTERGLEQAPVRDALLQGVRDCAWLLVNFLEHEVAVLTFLRRICAQFTVAHGSLDAVAVLVDDPHGPAPDLGDVAFLQKHETTSHRKKGGDIRGDEVFLHSEADDDRTAFARQNDAIRIMLAHDRERISAFELGDGGPHRLEQVTHRLQMMMNAMRDHLRVGLGSELVALALQLGA